MTQEQLRMQFLSGIITEGQYKAKLNENIDNWGSEEDDYGNSEENYRTKPSLADFENDEEAYKKYMEENFPGEPLDLEEDQYKEKLEENSDKMKYLEDALRNVWNMGKDNNPIDFNKLAKSIDDDMFTILNNALEKYTSEMDDSEVY
jgi:hypothetical protein